MITKFVSSMYRLSRVLNMVNKWSSGDPKRIARYYRNKYAMRALTKGKGGFLGRFFRW